MAGKLPQFQKVSEEDLSSAPKGAWIEAITTPLNDILGSANSLLKGGLTFKQNIKSEIKELIVSVPDVWQSPTFTNSWVNYGAGGFENAGYHKDQLGYVHLRGTIKNGVAIAAFTLPVGYRPFGLQRFPIMTDTGVNFAAVYSTGVVEMNGGTGAASLDGITFLADDASPVALSCYPLLLSTRLLSPPLGISIMDVQDITDTNPKRLGATCHVEWEYVSINNKPNIKINNICGLPYKRKYRIRFLVIGE